jgi:hypothetical protein
MKTDNFIVAFVLVALIILIGACERARWNECRRVHPWWYCFEDQGRTR